LEYKTTACSSSGRHACVRGDQQVEGRDYHSEDLYAPL